MTITLCVCGVGEDRFLKIFMVEMWFTNFFEHWNRGNYSKDKIIKQRTYKQIQHWTRNSLLNQCLTIKPYYTFNSYKANLISNQTYTLNDKDINKENHNDLINEETMNMLIPIMISVWITLENTKLIK